MGDFVMGARLQMADMASKSISQVRQATDMFKASVTNSNTSLNRYVNASGKARDANGRFIKTQNDANVSTRAWITSNGKLGASFSIVKRGLTGLAAGFGLMKAKDWFIDGNAEMETYRNTLTTVLKSEKQAVSTLAWAQKFAAKTPFEIPQVVEATTRMTAYGINAQKTMGIVGDMASVMGKDLMQAVEAVADAQTGELERLKEFGITKKMIVEQAKAMKITAVNNKGQITDQKAFNAVLFKLMEKRFKGGMELQSKTFKGMMSNAQDFIATTGRTLGKPVFDAAKNGLSGILTWANKLQSSGAIDAFAVKMGKMTTVVVQTFGTIRTYVVGIIQQITTKIQAWYTTNKPTINALGAAFIVAFNTIRQAAITAFKWINTTGLPLLMTGLGKAATLVLNIAKSFVDNWSAIAPILTMVCAGIAAYNGYMLITIARTKLVDKWTKITAVTTKMYTAYQLAAAGGAGVFSSAMAALNAVMAVNPVLLIVIAIAALVAGFIYAYKNVGWFRDGVNNACKAIANFFIGAIAKIKGAFNAVVSFFKQWGLTILLILTWPFTAIPILIYKNFDAIKAFIMGIPNAIMTAFNAAVGFFKKWGLTILAVITGPVGMIALAVYKNWDAIKAFLANGVAWIKSAFNSVGQFISTVFGGLVSVLKAPINFLISAMNVLIRGLNSISVKTPDWLPGIGGKTFGFHIKEIPMLAKGTSNFKGGQAIVGEEGPELVTMPRGSRVNTAAQTSRILDRAESRGISIGALVEKIVIEGYNKDPEQLLDLLIARLKQLLEKADEIAGSTEMGVLLNG